MDEIRNGQYPMLVYIRVVTAPISRTKYGPKTCRTHQDKCRGNIVCSVVIVFGLKTKFGIIQDANSQPPPELNILRPKPTELVTTSTYPAKLADIRKPPTPASLSYTSSYLFFPPD